MQHGLLGDGLNHQSPCQGLGRKHLRASFGDQTEGLVQKVEELCKLAAVVDLRLVLFGLAMQGVEHFEVFFGMDVFTGFEFLERLSQLIHATVVFEILLDCL